MVKEKLKKQKAAIQGQSRFIVKNYPRVPADVVEWCKYFGDKVTLLQTLIFHCPLETMKTRATAAEKPVEELKEIDPKTYESSARVKW